MTWCLVILAAAVSLASAPGGLTGTSTWGEGGAVRLLVPRVEFDEHDVMRVVVINEGNQEIALRRTDSWKASAGDSEPTALAILEESKGCAALKGQEALVVPAHRSETVCFSAKPIAGRTLTALAYQGATGELVARHAYTPPEVRLEVPVAYPPAAKVTDTQSGSVTLSAFVAPDGHVEGIELRGADPQEAALAAAAREALAQWVFEPATEDGVAQRWLHAVTFRFGAWRAAAATFARPAAELEPAVLGILRKSFPDVAVLSGGSIAVFDRSKTKAGVTAAQGFRVRVGSDPADAGRSWVSASASMISTPADPERCGCTWWDPIEREASQLIERIARALDADVDIRTYFAKRRGHTPSGLPEPDVDAEAWEFRDYLRNELLRVVGQDNPACLERASHEAETPPITATSDTSDVVQPRLVKKTTPAYPERARESKLKGRVILQAFIDKEGRIGDIEVLRTSDPIFDSSARDAVCGWRYTPGQRGGQPVSINFTIVIEYEIN